MDSRARKIIRVHLTRQPIQKYVILRNIVEHLNPVSFLKYMFTQLGAAQFRTKLYQLNFEGTLVYDRQG